MSFYANLLGTAERLIKQFGKPGFVERLGQSTGPAWDPQPDQIISSEITLVETSYSLTNRNETLIKAGDKLGIIAASGNVAAATAIVIDDVRFQLNELKPLNPGGTILLYEFHAVGPGEPLVNYQPFFVSNQAFWVLVE